MTVNPITTPALRLILMPFGNAGLDDRVNDHQHVTCASRRPKRKDGGFPSVMHLWRVKLSDNLSSAGQKVQLFLALLLSE